MENPLLKNSLGTKVIGLFGSDNSIAGLVAPFAIGLASGRFRSFDYVNVNHMLYFEGRKCSTSKRHGIWVSELLEQTSVTSDELRYYLFHAPLDESISDVTTEGLVASVNKLRDWLRDRLMPTQRLSGSNWSAALLSRLEYALKEQNRALQPNHVHLKKAVEVMDSWIYSPNMDFYEPAIASTWLAGTALLGEPIIPYLASRIWKQLGLPNQPRTAALATCLSPSDQLSVTSREPIAESEIRPYIHYEVGFEI
jgi:methionyl-tRNA synthetase